MATTKKTTRKRQIKKTPSQIDTLNNDIELTSSKDTKSSTKNPLILILLLAIIVLGVLAFRYKHLFVVAMVNNKPITSWQLNEAMRQSYGQQTLDQIVVETLLKNEAQKRNITVSQEEINQEFQNVEASLGGFVSLDEALEQQGMTRNDLEDQVRLRLMVTKLVGDNITVSDEEVNEYIEANSEYIQEGADMEQTKQDIREYLREQKVNEQIQELIRQLKENANIVTFI